MEVGKIAPPWEFLLYSAVRWEKKNQPRLPSRTAKTTNANQGAEEGDEPSQGKDQVESNQTDRSHPTNQRVGTDGGDEETDVTLIGETVATRQRHGSFDVGKRYPHCGDDGHDANPSPDNATFAFDRRSLRVLAKRLHLFPILPSTPRPRGINPSVTDEGRMPWHVSKEKGCHSIKSMDLRTCK